jgi:3-deoxy-D-manno-octulosonic-acid transferase
LLGRRFFKDRHNPQAQKRWLERLGIYASPPPPPGGIWIHAVSVGEFLAVVSLIRNCQIHFPNKPIIITTTTPTAAAQVDRIFSNQVIQVYFPYDLPWIVKRFLNHFKPAIGLIVETELWPNLFSVCQQMQVPVFIINACLSMRSLKGYQRCKILSGAMMDRIQTVCAQSEQEGARFVSLGLKADHLSITGNLKFDQTLPIGIIEKGHTLRTQWGLHRPVWIAASTHPGEENIILNTFKQLRQTVVDLLLVIAPRHPDRSSDVIQMIQDAGYEPVRRSHSAVPNLNTAVYLIDTLGELNLFYSASDIAFVGGSFVPIGGHNVLEPALFAVPIVVGPSMFNCLEVMAPLKAVGGLVQVQDEAQLTTAVAAWLSAPTTRRKAGLKAQQVLEENRGAVSKTIACMQVLLQ